MSENFFDEVIQQVEIPHLYVEFPPAGSSFVIFNAVSSVISIMELCQAVNFVLK